MAARWSEHEARGALSAWKKSGLPLDTFAKKCGIVPQRLRNWRKKLDGATTTALATTDAPVQLLPVQVTTPKRGEPVAVYLRSGHVVRVGRGFDEDAFSRVIALLERP